ncbi:hypothetical protein ACHAO9_005942 [Fusarium lateritium]
MLGLSYAAVITCVTVGIVTASPSSFPTQRSSIIPRSVEGLSQGCFSSLSNTSYPVYSSPGNTRELCSEKCNDSGKGLAVAVMRGNSCGCAATFPPVENMFDDGICDSPCPGNANSTCGASVQKAYTYINTGIELAPKHDRNGLIPYDPTEPEMQSVEAYRGCSTYLPTDIETYSLPYHHDQACYQICKATTKRFMMRIFDMCYCTDAYPASDTLVPNEDCTISCMGIDTPQRWSFCGGALGEGKRAYSVYDTSQPWYNTFWMANAMETIADSFSEFLAYLLVACGWDVPQEGSGGVGNDAELRM